MHADLWRISQLLAMVTCHVMSAWCMTWAYSVIWSTSTSRLHFTALELFPYCCSQWNKGNNQHMIISSDSFLDTDLFSFLCIYTACSTGKLADDSIFTRKLDLFNIVAFSVLILDLTLSALVEVCNANTLWWSFLSWFIWILKNKIVRQCHQHK